MKQLVTITALIILLALIASSCTPPLCEDVYYETRNGIREKVVIEYDCSDKNNYFITNKKENEGTR